MCATHIPLHPDLKSCSRLVEVKSWVFYEKKSKLWIYIYYFRLVALDKIKQDSQKFIISKLFQLIEWNKIQNKPYIKKITKQYLYTSSFILVMVKISCIAILLTLFFLL